MCGCGKGGELSWHGMLQKLIVDRHLDFKLHKPQKTATGYARVIFVNLH